MSATFHYTAALEPSDLLTAAPSSLLSNPSPTPEILLAKRLWNPFTPLHLSTPSARPLPLWLESTAESPSWSPYTRSGLQSAARVLFQVLLILSPLCHASLLPTRALLAAQLCRLQSYPDTTHSLASHLLFPRPIHSYLPLCLILLFPSYFSSSITTSGKVQLTQSNPCVSDLQKTISLYFRACITVVQLIIFNPQPAYKPEKGTISAFVYLPIPSI